MKVSLAKGALANSKDPLLAVFVAEKRKVQGLSPALAKVLEAPRRLGDFTGKRFETALTYANERQRLLMVGLGDVKDLDAEALRRAAAAVTRRARALKVARVSVGVDDRGWKVKGGDVAQAVAEGLVLGAYWFHGERTEKPEPPVRQARVHRAGAGKEWAAGLRAGNILGEAQCLARDLGNRPGNVATPQHLASEARRIARKGGLRCKVMQKAELEKKGYGGLLGVNAGSARPPVFLELEYKPARPRKTVCLVGKGLTFDTGGISLKPSAAMEEMKYDMCGGAAVLGAMQAVAALKPKDVRVIGLVPSTENMPGGRAIKPGDVLKTYGGVTIEVINTDAEGRLILADALGRAQDFDPDYTIDLATLTGACVVALGHRATGLFSASDDFARRLVRAGEATGERLWRLPHWDEYQEDMKSTVADIKNSGPRWGGAITAYAFLKKFSGDLTWAHLDIAGTAWDTPRNETYENGATGVGVRTLIRFLEDL